MLRKPGFAPLSLLKQLFIAVHLLLLLAPGALHGAGIQLPQTGQVTSYATSDDGALRKGVAWPAARFRDNANGTVTDVVTGLDWTGNANLPSVPLTWRQALDSVRGMNAGIYPNFGFTDWRLPNINELESLVNLEQANQADWLNGSGYSSVQPDYYWSSTTTVREPASAWCVSMSSGSSYGRNPKSSAAYFWPVRGGEVAKTSRQVIAAGAFHSMYLKPDGSLAAWGDNRNGWLAPLPALGPLTAIAASRHSLALKTDGTVAAWGDNSFGQAAVPEGLTGVVEVQAGRYHSLALKADGTVVAWGGNQSGQSTVPDGLNDVVAVSAGTLHSLALKADGSVVAWGENGIGQSTVPAGLDSVIAVAAAQFHSLALRSDGTVVAWGGNLYGQATVPTGLAGVVAIAARGTYSLALKSDGTVVVWGDDLGGRLAVPSGLSDVVAVAAGVYHVIAQKADGTIVGWGDNEFGQSTVPSDLSDFVSLSAGTNHTLALQAAGTVIAWGNGSYGGTIVPAGLSAVAGIAAGTNHSLAVKSDGTVVAWGDNRAGQVSVPEGLAGVTAVAAGTDLSLALASDGLVTAWGSASLVQAVNLAGLSQVQAISLRGYNGLALKMDGSLVAWGGLEAPAGLSGITSVAAGASHSLALRGDGTVVAWGDNSFGQSEVPAGLAGVVAVSAGDRHSLAVKSDGTVVAWGDPLYGQSTVPAVLSGVVAIAAAEPGYSAAVRLDGTLIAWGAMSLEGEMGTTNPSPAPPLVAATPAGGAYAAPQTVTLAADQTAIIRYTLDGSDPAQTSLVYRAPFEIASDATLRCQAVNGAGKTGPELVYSYNIVDTQPPTVRIDSPLAGSTTPQSVLLSYQVSDGAVVVKLDGSVIDVTSGSSLESLSVGQHLLRVEATDSVGNVSFDEIAFTAGISPTLDFTRMPGFSNISRQTLTGTRSQGATLAVSANTSATFGEVSYPTADSWSLTVSNLAEGENVLAFVLTSGAGVRTEAVRTLRFCGSRGVGTGKRKVIVAGEGTNFRLNEDGTVTAWGWNFEGMVTSAWGLSDVKVVAAGRGHALGVKTDGTVVAWGDNLENQATVPVGLGEVVSVAAGWHHSLALKSDGTVAAWGGNYSGQTTVPAGLSDVVAVSAGIDFSLALKSDGTVVGWGYDGQGVVSASTALSEVVAISAGEWHAVALKYDGTVVAFGQNGMGEATVPEGLTDVVEIDAKYSHNLALRADGTVTAWGANYYGESTVPAGLTDVVAVAAGAAHSLALKSDGSMMAWGDNEVGQTVLPSDLSNITAVATNGIRYGLLLQSDGTVRNWGGMGAGNAPADLADVVAVAAGVDNAIALKSDGTVVGWGAAGGYDIPEGLAGVASIAVGGSGNSLALKTDGTVVAWGGAVPAVPDGLSGVAAVAAGSYHSLALKYDGTLVAWGDNSSGQTTLPEGLAGVVAVAAGETFSLALKSDGTVVGWGHNPYPIPEGLTDVVAISAGGSISLALKSDGTVVAWGHSWFSGDMTPPEGLSDVVAIAAGSSSLALRSDGTVVSWGDVALKGENAGVETQLPGPPIAFVHPVTGAYNKPVSVTLSADRPATIHYTTDGSTPTQSSPVYSGPIAVSSSTVVRFFPVGDDGRVGQLRSGTYLIDTVPPVIGIVSPAPGLNASTTPLLQYTLNEGTAVVKVDGVVISTLSGAALDALSVGDHLLRIEAVDSFGNTSFEEFTFTIDHQPPVLNFTWMPAFSSVPTQTITGTRSEGSTLSVTVNGSEVAGVTYPDATTWSVAVSQLAEGDNRLDFSLTSEFGKETLATRNTRCSVTPRSALGNHIAGGGYHTLRVKTDGTVAAQGRDAEGQSTVPHGLTDVTAVAAGYEHSLALKKDGTVVAWGSNLLGEAEVPEGLSHVVAVSAGSNFSLALKSDGSVVAWGDGSNAVPEGLSEVVGISAGLVHSLALKADGSVVSWGSNLYGQVPVPNGLADVVSVAGGGAHSLALKSDGTVVQWGNDRGQNAVPEGLTDVVAISAGDGSSLALKADGTVVVWGGSYWATPTVPAGVSGVLEIASGLDHQLVLKNDGTLIAWGQNVYGQCTQSSALDGLKAISASPLGWEVVGLKTDGTIAQLASVLYPNPVASELSGVSSVSSGGWDSLALMDDGLVVPWGSLTSRFTAIPEGLSGVAAVAAGFDHALALKMDGTLLGWGSNYYGEGSVPGGITSVRQIAAGGYYSLALLVDGSVVSWGRQIGDGTFDISTLSGVVGIAAGYDHALALKSDGTIVAWGTGAGQASVPEGLTGVTAVAAGDGHSLALKSDGTVVAWGSDLKGAATVPAGLKDVVAIAAGQFSLALKSDGTLVTWGGGVLSGDTAPTSTATTLPIAFTEPASGAYNTPQSVTLSANQPVAIHYTTDGSNPTTSSAVYSEPITVSSDTTIRFIAVSPDGTVGPVRSGTYSIDSVPPVIEVASPRAGFVTTTTPLLDYSLSEGSAVVKVDGAPIGTPNGQSLDHLAQGNHLLRIEAKDRAGNSSFKEVSFTVDSIAPAVESGTGLLISRADQQLLSGTVEPGATLAASVDTTAALGAVASPGPGSWSIGVTGLAPGKNVVVLVATDAAGNQTTTSKTVYYAKRTGADTIAAGASYSMRLNPDETVVGWGNNTAGQASAPSGLSGVVAIEGGEYNPMALKRDGTVAVWGNGYGQESVPASLTDVVSLAAGRDSFLSLKSDGTVVGWGDNANGELTVPQGLDNVIAIAAGNRTYLALRVDGTVVAWGNNDYGQVAVPSLTDVIAVAAGHSHSLALRSDGTVVAWGSNGFGEAAVPPALLDVVAIAAGGYGSLALKADGTVAAWGDNRYGQTEVPAGLSDVVAITSGQFHSLALKSDGTVVPWGDNGSGECTLPVQLANMSAVSIRSSSTLALTSGGTVFGWGENAHGQVTPPQWLADVFALAAGTGHALALKYDGTVAAWGDDSKGQRAVPAGLSDVFGIAAGADHSLALKFDGSVVAWGDNSYGQSSVPDALSGVAYIAAGDNFSIALKSDGTAAAWGDNAFGQLNAPAGGGLVSIAAGKNHAAAVKYDGTVIAWGENGYGQTDVPAGLTDVKGVAAGANHTLALKADGTVIAWGDNRSGEATVPAGLSDVVAIAAGNGISVAVKGDGTLVEWGGVLLKGEAGGAQSPDLVPITTPHPAPGTYAAPQTVWLSSSRKGTIYYTTDGSTPTTSSAVYDAPISVASTATVRFFAVSSTGKDEEVKSATYVIDSIVPSITVISPRAGLTNSATPLLSYSVSDGNVVVTLDGESIAPASGSNLPTLEQGGHLLRVQATDGVGNTGYREVSFTVDSVPPALAIDQYAPVSNVTNQPVSGSVEAGVAVTVSVDTAAIVGAVGYPASGTWSVDISGLVTDDNRVTVNAVDAAGNRSAASCIIRYNLAPVATSATLVTTDNMASIPVVPIVNGGNTLDIYTFAVLAQPKSGTAAVVDGKLVYTPNSGYFGTDSFSYSVTDQGGLGIAATAYVVVNAANPAPVFGAAAMVESNSRVRLSWTPSASADAASYQIYSDNGTGTISYAAPYAMVAHPAASFVTPSLPDGNYQFVVRTKDASGLEEKNTSLVFARVDTTAPLSVPSVTGRIQTGNRVAVSWPASPSPDVSRYDIYSDNGTGTVDYGVPVTSVNSNTLSYTTPELVAGGSYRFSVIAQDGSGNRSAAAVSPQVSLIYPDLVVSSVDWNKEMFFFGDELQLTARVTNVGSVPTSAQGFYLGFHLDDGLAFQKYYAGQIQPGSYADIVTTQKMFFAARSYTLAVTADNLNGQVEQDEANNSLRKPFTVTSNYLVALLVDRPAYSAGRTVKVVSQVADSTTPSTYFSDADVTVTCEIRDGTGNAVLAPVTMGYLAATRTFTADMELPAALATGIYRIAVTATGKVSGVTKRTEQDLSVVEGVELTIQPSSPKYYVKQQVLLTGTVRTVSGETLPNKPVSLILSVNGMSQAANVTTGADGSYAYAYTPPVGIGGNFTVSAACTYNNLTTTAGTSFTVEGLYITPSGVNLPNMTKNTTVNVVQKVKLRNIGTEPVSGIVVVLEDNDVTDVVTGQLSGSDLPASLAPGETVDLDFSITAGLAAPNVADFILMAAADAIPAGSQAFVPVRVSLVEPTPVPVVTPNSFTAGVQPGGKAVRQITFKNGGYGILQNVTVQPPATGWIAIVGGDMGTLQPGEVRTFDVVATPPEDQLLGHYQVPLSITSTEVSAQLVNGTFEVTSSQQGDISFRVTDDVGTFVQGAKVTLISQKDYVFPTASGAELHKNIVAAVADASGTARFTGIDIGPYDFQVDADNHDTVKGQFSLQAGENSPGIVVNMVASLVNVEWSVTPTTVADHYTMDLTMNLVVPEASAGPPPKPVLFLNPNAIEISLTPGEEYSGQISIVTPSPRDLSTVTIDASQLKQQGIELVFLEPGGESDKKEIDFLPARVEMTFPFKARLLAGAPTTTRNLGLIIATGNYSFADAITGAETTGTTSAFTSVRFREVPAVTAGGGGSLELLSLSTSPSVVTMTEYCSGWFPDSNENQVAVNVPVIKVTNTNAEPISLGKAYGITSDISALDTLKSAVGYDLVETGWSLLNGHLPLPAISSIWDGEFSSYYLAPGESAYLTLKEHSTTEELINLPDVGLKFGGVFFFYGNQQKPSVQAIPILVAQVCTNGISIPVMHTDPNIDGIVGDYNDWSVLPQGDGGRLNLPPGFGTVNLPSAPPAPSESAMITLKLNQTAAVEREVFTANLELTALVADMSNVKVGLVVRKQGATDDSNNLFVPVVSSLSGINSVNGDGFLAKGAEGIAQWTIVPQAGAGGGDLAGISYEVGARIMFSVNGMEKTVETSFVPINVKPEPSLIVDYFVHSMVKKNEPFKLRVRVKNEGPGVARNFSITSPNPAVSTSLSGVAGGFTIVGSFAGGVENRAGDTKLAFNDIPPGQTAEGYWLISTPVDGIFTSFNGTLQHVGYGGLPLTPVIKEVHTYFEDAIFTVFQTQGGNKQQNEVFLGSVNGDNDYISQPELALLESGEAAEVVSHALYPVEFYTQETLEKSGFVSRRLKREKAGEKACNPDFEPSANDYAQEDPNDARQPLILVHGWEGDPDSHQSPRELVAPLEWNCVDYKIAEDGNLGEGYWYNFIEYFNRTEELKQKYRLYVYHYPSYKHVTFNARVFSKLLGKDPYLKQWLDKGANIKILGHSMGGLVSRSLIEEHKVEVSLGGTPQMVDGFDILDKLITTATPHHGSPASVFWWVPAVARFKKDLGTPGSQDLFWDNYDGIFADAFGDVHDGKGWRNNLDAPDDGYHVDTSNSGRVVESRSFDTYYRNSLAEFAPDSNKNKYNEMPYVVYYPLAESINVYRYPNPWLSNLNENFRHPKNGRSYADKYIFYGGYNDAYNDSLGNRINDIGLSEVADDIVYHDFGYINDYAVPLTSAFLDYENTAGALGSSTRNPVLFDFNGKVGKYIPFLSNTTSVIAKDIVSELSASGIRSRVFKDYNHDRMLNGAYFEESEDLHSCSVHSGFNTEDAAKLYLAQGGVWLTPLLEPSGPETGAGSTSEPSTSLVFKNCDGDGIFNKLMAEPLFNLWENDLLADPVAKISAPVDRQTFPSNEVTVEYIASGGSTNIFLDGEAKSIASGAKFTGLTDGVHTLKVETGAVSHQVTFTVDTHPPVDGTVTSSSGDSSVYINWSGFADATSGVFSYKVVSSETGFPSSCEEGTVLQEGFETALALSNLVNGRNYYFRVCALDGVGNISGGATVAATPTAPDTTAPTGSIVAKGGANYTRQQQVTVTPAATDPNGVTQMCISDSDVCGGWEAYSGAPRQLMLQGADGVKTVLVWFRDSLGNANLTPYSTNITLDTTPPQLSLSTLSDGSVTNNNVLNVSGTVSDLEGVSALTINDAAVDFGADGTFSQALTLRAGGNPVTVYVTDVAGNTTTQTRNITLDLTAPVLSLDSPADNSKTAQAFLVISGAVDENARVVFTVNGGAPQSAGMDGSTLAATAILASGLNTIEVTATDPAGNTTTAKRTVTYDDAMPALAVTTPNQDISTNKGSLAIAGTVADLLSATTITVSVDGTTYTPAVTDGSFSQTVSFTQQKSYRIVVTATDEVGNTSTVLRNVVYDLAPPEVSADSGAVITNQSSIVLTGKTDVGAVVAVSCPTAVVGEVGYPSGGTWIAPVSTLTEGANEVTVVATDLAGNSATTRMVVTKDTVEPITTPSVAGAAFNASQNVTLAANEGATIYYTTDGSTPTTASPTYTAPVVISHDLTLKFFAVDLAANTESVRAESYVIDAAVPTINEFTAAQTSGTLLVGGITLHAVDNVGVTGYCLSEIGSVAACTWSASPRNSFTFGSEGNKTLYAFARDAVGNVSAVASATLVIALPINASCGTSDGGTFTTAPATALCSSGVASMVTGGVLWNWSCIGLNGGGSVGCSASMPDTAGPALIVATLEDGSVTGGAALTISGSATDLGGIKNLLVNGTEVVVKADGTFSTSLSLKSGANVITTVATDLAGNSTSDVRSITLAVAMPGDCNGDGRVDISEVQSSFNMHLGTKAVAACVDTDGDSIVGIAEVQKSINSFLGL